MVTRSLEGKKSTGKQNTRFDFQLFDQCSSWNRMGTQFFWYSKVTQLYTHKRAFSYFFILFHYGLSQDIVPCVVHPSCIQQDVCFCASTTLFWSLQPCSIISSLGGLCLLLCFFFLKTALTILGLLQFSINIRVICLNSVKNEMC